MRELIRKPEVESETSWLSRHCFFTLEWIFLFSVLHCGQLRLSMSSKSEWTTETYSTELSSVEYVYVVHSDLMKLVSILHSTSKLKISGTSRNVINSHRRSKYLSSFPGVFPWHVLWVTEQHFWTRSSWKKGSQTYVKNQIQINVDLSTLGVLKAWASWKSSIYQFSQF